jgi:hypothetical protein
MTFTEEITELFILHYDARDTAPATTVTSSVSWPTFLKRWSQGERIFTIDEWEANADAEYAETEAAKTIDGR